MSSGLLTFYRALTRHKLYALLNIGGLALGIAVFLVLFLFVRFEKSYDNFPGSQNLWLIQEQYFFPGVSDEPSPWTMQGELDELQADFPDLVGTRFQGVSAAVRDGDRAASEDLAAVDANYFELFGYPVIAGDPTATLADPDGLVLTESIARRYFGEESPIGRTLALDLNGEPYRYKVGAVIHDLPPNSTFDTTMFVPFLRERFGSEVYDHWGSSNLLTFLQFRDAAAAEAFAAKLPDFIERHAGADGNFSNPVSKTFRQSILPVGDLHLLAPADRAMVTTLAVVGLLTLLIAIFNYVNLATARSGLRAREVALRKVLGASRAGLIRQFMGEAVATVALAALIGLALAELALPFVNAAGGSSLEIAYLGSGGVLMPLVALVLVVGLIAGAYPALALSGFRPASVLASARAPGGGRAGTRLRQGLVVLQFGIAILFAIGTTVMIAQMAHIRSADIGFHRDGLFVVSSYVNADQQQQDALLREFARLPGVTSVTRANNAPGRQFETNSSNFHRIDQDGPSPSVLWVPVGEDYFATFGARLLAGRLFDAANRASDDTASEEQRGARNVVLNATAVDDLGFADAQAAVGALISNGSDRDSRVVGVVEDMRFDTPRQSVRPTLYMLDTVHPRGPLATIRYRNASPAQIETAVEATWKRIAPGVPFKGQTADQSLYESYYKQDAQRANIFTLGAALAVLIGCIGLYGLAAFDTTRRIKEIGIRKTLGASTGDVLRLLLGRFLQPVLLANLIAWPLAWFALRSWLSGFDDRVALSPFYFLLASAVATLIAVLTIIGQSWKVARAEPARALRYE
ncbi:ABC transporter permease [Stakelama tenebrarum]|uniref:FtsX-like permease family protein n=1 Tax=Stakelama tenebrarum TaxID=2711215 RepID=A0A6G6YAI2_9SPHN|nr:ABC transporter permease [Sphingosinithalassobacter tenebrarum]QIG81583.1 FtsX-like permease family protein [Sphingosinithalassobacter tenebrarum]